MSRGTNLTKAIRLTAEENSLFSAFAEAKGMTFTSLCKAAILEKIEDETDIKLADASYTEYLASGKKTKSLDRLIEELNQ